MAKKKQGQSINEEALRKRFALVQDYRRFFQTEQGKRVLHDLMREHSVMTHTFAPADPLTMAYKEGQRNVVLRIFQICQMEPSEMEKQIMEASNVVAKVSK